MQSHPNINADWRVVAYLMRHGETNWNRVGFKQGWADVPLNEAGRYQARQAAHVIADLDIEACYSSDLSRARETGHIALSKHPHVNRPIVETGLRERFFGRMEGRRTHEIYDDIYANPDHYYEDARGRTAANDSEEVVAFENRVTQTLHTLTSRHTKPPLIVSHGAVLGYVFRNHAVSGPSKVLGNGALYALATDGTNCHVRFLWAP